MPEESRYYLGAPLFLNTLLAVQRLWRALSPTAPLGRMALRGLYPRVYVVGLTPQSWRGPADGTGFKAPTTVFGS
jgi:hypothetical protein